MLKAIKIQQLIDKSSAVNKNIRLQISPASTKACGICGLWNPNEVKIKYLADNDLADLSGEEAIKAMKEKIKTKMGKKFEKEYVGLPWWSTG